MPNVKEKRLFALARASRPVITVLIGLLSAAGILVAPFSADAVTGYGALKTFGFNGDLGQPMQ